MAVPVCFGTWSVKKFRSLCTHSPGIYAYLQVSTRFQTVERYSWIHIPVGMASVDLERFIQNSRSGRKQTFSSTPQHGLELALHPATSQNAVVPSNFSQPQWGQINEDPAPPAVHTGGGVVNNYGCLILNLPACDGSAATQIVRSFIENMPQSAGRNPPTYACVGGGSIAGVSQESAAGQQTQVASNLGNTGHVPGIPAAPLAFITRATEASAPAAPVVPQRDEITQEAPVASQGVQITQAAPVASQVAPVASQEGQSEQATGSAGTGKTSFPWSKIFMGLFLFVVAVALGVCIWYHIQWVNGLVKTVQELSAEKNRNASPRGNDTAPTPSPQPAPVPPTHSPTPQPLPKEDAKTPTSKQGAESPVSHMPHGNTTIQTNNSSCTFFYPCQSSQVQSGNQSVSNNTTPLTGKPSADPAPEQAKQGMNPTQKLDWVPLGCNLTNWENPLHNGTPCSDLIPKNVTVQDCVAVCNFGQEANGLKKCCPCARLKEVCKRR